jgi:FKBP-type peptidyl-prolyl cis-trans isomerase FkpA
MKASSLLFLGLSLLLFSCHNDDEQQQNNTPPQPSHEEVKEALIKSHQMYVKQEADEITQYIKQHGYNMQGLSTGMYYMITEHGKGEQAAIGDFATLSYSISLLDGTVCYDSKTEGAKQILVGKDAVESGVHQAIELMHAGDKGLFIIPSYLAQGLVGDKDKIPPGAVVIYDIHLVSLKKQKAADTNSK